MTDLGGDENTGARRSGLAGSGCRSGRRAMDRVAAGRWATGQVPGRAVAARGARAGGKSGV